MPVALAARGEQVKLAIGKQRAAGMAAQNAGTSLPERWSPRECCSSSTTLLELGSEWGVPKSRARRAPQKKARLVGDAQDQKQRRAAATALVNRARPHRLDAHAKCLGWILRKDFTDSKLLSGVRQLPKTKRQLQFREHTKQIQRWRDRDVIAM